LNPELDIDDRLVDNILRELEDALVEKVYSKEIFGITSASAVINLVDTQQERETIKKDVIKAFVVSSRTQRLYFIVRSIIMTIAGALITLAVFLRLGTINLIEDFILGITSYLICLTLTRLLDARIVEISGNMLIYLNEHTKLRDFVVSHF
jgi:hypothetical protein